MPGDRFVGREPELKALERFLGKAAAGQTQVIFVAGEAGAGKSALVNEFVRRTEEADPKLVAAIGECNAQTGLSDAYLPFRQVLTTLSGAQDEKETGKMINATNAVRLRELVRLSGETLLDIGPDLVGIFVPGASLFARLATSVASNTPTWTPDRGTEGQIGRRRDRPPLEFQSRPGENLSTVRRGGAGAGAGAHTDTGSGRFAVG